MYTNYNYQNNKLNTADTICIFRMHMDRSWVSPEMLPFLNRSVLKFFSVAAIQRVMLFSPTDSWRADEYNMRAGPEEMYPLVIKKGSDDPYERDIYGVDPCSLYTNYIKNMRLIYSEEHQRELKELCDREVGQSEAREISSMIESFLIPSHVSAFFPMAEFNIKQLYLRQRKHAKDTRMRIRRLTRMIRDKPPQEPPRKKRKIDK